MDTQRLLSQDHSVCTAPGVSGGAPLTSKEVPGKSPLGLGCWEGTDGHREAGTGVGVGERRVAATSERLG